MPPRLLLLAAVAAVLLALASDAAPQPAAASGGILPASSIDAHGAVPAAPTRWRWPVPGARAVGRAYQAPPGEYSAGHRGVDVVARGATTVLSPADGVVVFAGDVAGRGVLVIDAGGGLLATLEPVDPALAVGATVGAGAVVGVLSAGGHTLPGAVHLGARLDGVYLNPLLLLGGGVRTVLLPCCA